MMSYIRGWKIWNGTPGEGNQELWSGLLLQLPSYQWSQNKLFFVTLFEWKLFLLIMKPMASKILAQLTSNI